jgi:diguanylate cyclase (GGDEF)-like protein
MKLRQYYAVIALVFASIVVISIVWEFWLEDLLGGSIFHTHAAESRNERWEYVYSIAVFVVLSLIIPFFYGRRLIIQQEGLLAQISRMAAEDALTGLFNRRKINELIQHEIERSERYNKGFSVIIIDIDYFKRVNDRHGHLAGDELLKMFTEILTHTIRHTDEVGRWGGEEFVVLCPETSLEGAVALANKIRQKIDHTTFNNYGKQTASFGIACYRQGDTMDSMISHADEALYVAKNAGRDRVEAHS